MLLNLTFDFYTDFIFFMFCERDAKNYWCVPLNWSSTGIRRVCNSTVMAEAYTLSNAVEHGLRTRAAIVDMRGQLYIRQWEETASAAMRHVWFYRL